MPIILGIESTAHTFGVGVVKNGKILANVKRTFTTEKGGLVPLEVAKFHFDNKNEIYFEALDKAGLAPKGVPRNISQREMFTKGKDKINAIAFSQGPGLAPCLLVGMKFAKELAKKLKVPLVPVNHCIAHLEVGTQGRTPKRCETPKDFFQKSLQRARTTKIKNAEAGLPVMIYTSGANTQIIAYAEGKYRIFGETLDIGVGNFIDNFARYAGIGFPGGPAIEKLASEGKNYIEIPYSVKGMDIALSGILTNLRRKIESNRYSLNDLAYSMQETVFAMLVETAERALAHTGKKELLLGGGVACNKRLQEMCKIMCDERGAKFFVPENNLLVDNGAMIAYLGEIMYRKEIYAPKGVPRNISKKEMFTKGKKDLDKIDIKPRQRTDDVEVDWKI
jgi:N6-L-threonylcarbamoyladenine synthase